MNRNNTPPLRSAFGPSTAADTDAVTTISPRTVPRKTKAVPIMKTAATEWMCQSCCRIICPSDDDDSCPICGVASKSNSNGNSNGNSKTSQMASRRKLVVKQQQQQSEGEGEEAGGFEQSSSSSSTSSLFSSNTHKKKKEKALANTRLNSSLSSSSSRSLRREDDGDDAADQPPPPIRDRRRNTSPVPPPTATSAVVVTSSSQPKNNTKNNSTNTSIQDILNNNNKNQDDDDYSDDLDSLRRDLRPVRSTFHPNRSSASHMELSLSATTISQQQQQQQFMDASNSSLNLTQVFTPSSVTQPPPLSYRRPSVVPRAEEMFPPVQFEQQELPPQQNSFVQHTSLTVPTTSMNTAIDEQHDQPNSDSFLSWSHEDQHRPWVCNACTFLNENALHLTCSLCSTLREKKDLPYGASTPHCSDDARFDSQEAAVRSTSEIIQEDWLETLQQERIDELIQIQQELLQEYHQ